MPVIENPIGLQLDEIVVATDFKPDSEAATEFARVLAKHYSSRITVAHVVDLSVASRSEEAVVGLPIDEMRHNGAENMEHLLYDLSGAGLSAHGQILEAHKPGAAIVGLADQVEADLIVLGSNARHGLDKMIVGSCAEGVIHHAKCPVITLGPKVKRETTKAIHINTIVFATDLEHDTAEKAAIALAFAKDNLARIYMCHVLEHAGRDFGESIERQLKTESALSRLIPESAYEWCSPEAIVEHGKVGEHLLHTAKRVGADLIVMGARRSNTWFSHLSEGVVGHVLAGAECPVMTICTD